MDATDWRTQLQADSRQRIVTKILETLKIHLPISSPEGLVELKKIAEKFERKIFSDATSQMLTMEAKSNAIASSHPQYPAEVIELDYGSPNTSEADQ